MIVSILLYILAGLVAGIAGAVAVLIFADVMFRICGSSLFEILDEMDISEVRLRDTILRAAESNEKFGETLNIANQGWRENTALQKEAQQRYKTTESQLQIAKNKLIDKLFTKSQSSAKCSW